MCLVFCFVISENEGFMNKYDKIFCSLKCNENVWLLIIGYIFNFYIIFGKCILYWILSSVVEIILIYILKKLLK